jgi:hypothetical protein
LNRKTQASANGAAKREQPDVDDIKFSQKIWILFGVVNHAYG